MDNSININFISSIFLNFYSASHLGTHIGILAGEGVDSFFSLFSGPIGFWISIAIHGIVILFNYIKDKLMKKIF